MSTKDSLLHSSHLFWKEATQNALAAQSGDATRWQLALLHIVLAAEHTLKAHLASIHPSLIRERIEEKSRTVSIPTAVMRLKDKEIGNVNFIDKDETALKKAADARNAIAHGQTDEAIESIRAKFIFVLAFVREHQFKYLNTRHEAVITRAQFQSLLKIDQQAREFERHANDRLSMSQCKFDTEEIFPCPDCGEPFVTLEDERAVCHFCQHQEDVLECKNCDRYIPESDMKDFSSHFEYWQGDGISEVTNRFGFDFSRCCSECFDEVISKIRDEAYDQSYDQYLEDLMMDSRVR